jgi:gliding motility-associated protein GldE
METDLLFQPILLATTTDLLLSFLLFCVLLTCAALIAGSEVAFFGLTPNDINDLADDESPSSVRISRLIQHPKRLLATILIGNNFVNIAIVLLSDFLLASLSPPALYRGLATFCYHLFQKWDVESWEKGLSFSVNVVGVTFLMVLFGEVVPKTYATIHKISLARFMSTPLSFMSSIFMPLSNFLIKTTKYVEKRLEKAGANNQMTADDLDEAIELTVRNDVDAETEVDILKRIVKFNDVSVKQVMRPRMDVVGIDFRMSYKEVLQIVRECGFSRLPVFDEDFDNMTGILYAKDLIDHLFEPDNYEWQALVRPNLIYVPESRKIHDLLKDFRKERMHLAIVVDEYGGSAGIVTLEDIMEEVIGEIQDEFDDELEMDFKKMDDFTYVFDGKTLLNDVSRVLKVDTETFEVGKGDSNSLAGLVLELQGGFPKVDTELTYGKYIFKVLSVNKRRIEKIQIQLPNT